MRERTLLDEMFFNGAKHLALTVGQRAFIRTLGILFGREWDGAHGGSFQVLGKHNAKRRENQTSVRGVSAIIEHLCHTQNMRSIEQLFEKEWRDGLCAEGSWR